jgi:hypothetical protein
LFAYAGKILYVKLFSGSETPFVFREPNLIEKIFGIRHREPTPEEKSKMENLKQTILEDFKAATNKEIPKEIARLLKSREFESEVLSELNKDSSMFQNPVKKSILAGELDFDYINHNDDFAYSVAASESAIVKMLIIHNQALNDLKLKKRRKIKSQTKLEVLSKQGKIVEKNKIGLQNFFSTKEEKTQVNFNLILDKFRAYALRKVLKPEFVETELINQTFSLNCLPNDISQLFEAEQITFRLESNNDGFIISAITWSSIDNIPNPIKKSEDSERKPLVESPKQKGLDHDCYSHFQNYPLPPKFQACRPSTLRIRITDPLRCASKYLETLSKPLKKLRGKDTWMIFTKDLKNILKESKPCYTRFPLNCRKSWKAY